MDEEQSDTAVRRAFGMSREDVAELAEVHRDTVRMYEANPIAVGATKRAAIAHVYSSLRLALRRIRTPRAKGVPDGQQAARDVPGAGAERGRKTQRGAG